MLIVRSLYVAVLGFWRFALVAPFLLAFTGGLTAGLVIGFTILALLTSAPFLIGTFAASVGVAFGDESAAQTLAVLVKGLGIAATMFGVLVYLIISAAMIFFGMVTIRTALIQQGVFNPVDVMALGKASFKYAVLLFSSLLVNAALFIMVGLVMIQFGYIDLPATIWTDKDHLLETLFANRTLQMLALACYLVSIVVYVVMMVPMAASAWSANTKGHPTDLIWGIGSGFLSLALIVGVSTFLNFYFGLFSSTFQLLSIGMSWLSSKMSESYFKPVPWEDLQPMVIALGVYMLTTYWQYVAATLAFLKRQGAIEAARVASLSVPKPEWIDPAELRKKRQNQPSIFHQ